MPGVTMDVVSDTGMLSAPYHLVGDAHEAALLGASLTGEGDVLLLIGAGDIFLQAETALQYWAAQAEPRK